jgi:hypothetical protein
VSDRRRDGVLVVLLRAGALAVAAVAFAWPVARDPGVVAAAVGAGLGVLMGQRLGESRLRLAVVGAGALALVALAAGASAFVVDGTWVPREVGPTGALDLAAAIELGLGGTGLAMLLRAASVRVPAFVVLEVVLSGAALAALVSAHRDGAIHRPHELADWAYARGQDPATLLVWLGAAGTLVLVVLLLGERRARRAPLHVGAVVLLLMLLLGGIRVLGLPTPRAASDLGLTGKPDTRGERGGRAGRRGGARPRDLSELPFRDEYRSQGSDAPVAVVVLHGEYRPPSSAFYLRQSAFSQWNGHRLVAATRSDVDRDLLESFPVEPVTVIAPPPAFGRAAVDATVALLQEHTRPFGIESPVSAKPEPNPDAARFVRAYRVQSRALVLPYEALLGHAAGDPRWPAEVREHYLRLPDDPRYRELAEQIAQGLAPQYANDPLAKALAVKEWLDDSGVYSRRSHHASAEDPTAHFLFGDRQGYCVHFAHAATLLYRALDVPARVASGYAVAEQNRGGGSAILVRGKEAHAWPEVYLEGVGWTIVDIQPRRSLEPPEAPPDPELQRTLGEMARGQRHLDDKARGRDRRDRARDLARQASRLLTAGARWALPLLAALVVLGWLVKLWRIALAPRLAGPRARPRVAYRAALDRLSAVGHARRRGETREEFAARVADLAPALGPLTWAHLGVYLGSRRPPPDDLGALPGQVARQVRRKVPLWRWALGIAHPFSWMGSR